MTRIRFSAMMAGLLLASPAFAQASDVTVGSTPESRFLQRLHEVNQIEIEAGKMAETQAEMISVKKYGREIVRDHRAADATVRKMAKMEKIMLVDAEGDAMEEMEKLKSLTGTPFDQHFLTEMITDHDQAIREIQTQRVDLRDRRVKSFATSVIKVMQGHRRTADELLGKVPSERQNTAGTTP